MLYPVLTLTGKGEGESQQGFRNIALNIRLSLYNIPMLAMQLKRYRLFIKLLGEETDLTGTIAGFEVYRKSDAVWLDSQETPVGDDGLKKFLDQILTRGSHARRKNSVTAFFPVSTFRAVIVTKSPSPTRKTTRDRIHKILVEVGKRANTEFDASHDGLTGLLNGRALEEHIRDIFNTYMPPSESGNAEVGPVASVGLIALDLDHFKQVNDLYGHEYGDIVLKCFAHRLENTVNAIRHEFGESVRFGVGRSGGEEFLIIISGDLSPDRIKDVAERIKASISEQELPTQVEWNLFSGGHSDGSVTLPHISERKVTASVGLSSLKARTTENVMSIVSELRREADAALFRAKGGGRDTVRYFPEIRDKFGTVLEHHQETNVVTIDIGSQVSVRVGQEFHVYHPDFTGKKNFIYSDGRSKKRLGVYPRFPSGRIVVFDVQPEISFCTVAETSLPRFPTGSILEQIPVGSIYHLVSAEAKASAVGAAQVTELDAHIEAIVGRKARPLAAVFCLRNMPSVEKARGTALVNRALAGLFEEVRQAFPLPAKICQVESDKIAVAAQIETKLPHRELILKIIRAASQKMSHLVEFTAGVFTVGVKLDPIDGDKSVLDPKRALSYARYASVASLTSDEPIELFTARTASRIIGSHRRQKTQTEALVDYQALHDLGVDYSGFENQAALAALELNQGDFALARMQRAITLEPDTPILKANLGFIQFKFRHVIQAHETFEGLHAKHPDFELDNIYIGAEALAAYAAYKEDPRSVNHSAVRALLEKAAELAASGEAGGRRDIILSALGELSAGTPAEGSDQALTEPNYDIAQIWTNLVEAIGRVSPFTRSYLLEAHPVSFNGGVFVIGFTPELKEHIALVDNPRNHNLITTKLREFGFEAVETKFIVS